MCRMTKNDKEKLGNTAVYIATHTKNLSKTKLLKLLYFMEEYSVRRFHTPFLGLPYEVWQAGPVVKDVFIDLSENLVILDGYVTKEVVGDATYILPAKSFSDEEFSDNDLLVMDEVIRKYGDKTAKELVSITHKKGSLWHKVAERNNLLLPFENKLMNNSDSVIDFSEELTETGKEFYQDQLEFLQMSRAFAKETSHQSLIHNQSSSINNHS